MRCSTRVAARFGILVSVRSVILVSVRSVILVSVRSIILVSVRSIILVVVRSSILAVGRIIICIVTTDREQTQTQHHHKNVLHAITFPLEIGVRHVVEKTYRALK